MFQESISFKNSRGDSLTGVFHHPAGATPHGSVILCHGMESDKQSEKLVLLSQALAERGILALRFDFSYSGESNGKFADITYSGEVDDLKAAYALVQSRRLGKIAIFGSSMGGSVALLFAGQEPTVAALVTVAAPVHPENFPHRLLTREQVQQWRDQGFTIHNGRRLNVSLLEDLERIDVPASAQKTNCPVLILHGDADEVVPVEEAYELYDCLPGPKRVVIFERSDHRLSNPMILQQAITRALEWLIEHVH